MTDVKGSNLVGTESGNGRTRKEACRKYHQLQSNESDALVLTTFELQPVLDCYVQGASRQLLLYKSIVVSFNITCCSSHHEWVVGFSITIKESRRYYRIRRSNMERERFELRWNNIWQWNE
jgi:hypothetical protein